MVNSRGCKLLPGSLNYKSPQLEYISCGLVLAVSRDPSTRWTVPSLVSFLVSFGYL
jgi:hypothetical protein